MLDILLVHPPITDFSLIAPLNSIFYELQLEPPLGLCYIGAMLEKEKYKVKILDMDILKSTESDLLQIIKTQKPKMIGIGINTMNFQLILKFTQKIKEFYPDIIIVLGGIHASQNPESLITQSTIDIVVVGEGEYTFTELAHFYLRNQGRLDEIYGIYYKQVNSKIKITPSRPEELNLDNFPFPARHLIMGDANSKYFSVIAKSYPIGTIITTRGCPFNCIFCSKLFCHPRFRSAQNIVEEIKYLSENFNVKDIQIMDETFNLNKKMNIEFCHTLRKERIDISWRARCRPDLVTEEILKEYRAANCYITTYGVESGSERILKILKKGYNLVQIENAFKTSQKLGLETHALFMIGIPGETITDLQKSIAFIRKLSPTYLQISQYYAIPHTELHERVLKHNYYDQNPWIYLKINRSPILKVKLPNLSQKSIDLFTKLGYANYILNPHFIWELAKNFLQNPSRYPNQIAHLCSYLSRQ